jgi:CBS-domain-containing membrane protein
MSLFAAQEWHFWLAPVMTVATILVVLALVVGYLVKVTGPRIPKR